MKDDDGRVLIPGWYDGIAIDARTKALLASVPDSPDAIRASFTVAALDRVASTPQEALQYPSLTIEGLGAAQVGEKSAAIIPDRAVAAMDIRTVPEIPAAKLVDAFERMVGELKVPFLLLPLVNADDNQHTDDENLRMGNYLSSIKALETMLTEPFSKT
jgi:acetylornithine deacetylase/succinyl-diaminopimelate desuccinylase-like protein